MPCCLKLVAYALCVVRFWPESNRRTQKQLSRAMARPFLAAKTQKSAVLPRVVAPALNKIVLKEDEEEEEEAEERYTTINYMEIPTQVRGP